MAVRQLRSDRLRQPSSPVRQVRQFASSSFRGLLRPPFLAKQLNQHSLFQDSSNGRNRLAYPFLSETMRHPYLLGRLAVTRLRHYKYKTGQRDEFLIGDIVCLDDSRKIVDHAVLRLGSYRLRTEDPALSPRPSPGLTSGRYVTSHLLNSHHRKTWPRHEMRSTRLLSETTFPNPESNNVALLVEELVTMAKLIKPEPKEGYIYSILFLLHLSKRGMYKEKFYLTLTERIEMIYIRGIRPFRFAFYVPEVVEKEYEKTWEWYKDQVLNVKNPPKEMDEMAQREQWRLVQEILDDGAVFENVSGALNQLLYDRGGEWRALRVIKELLAKREEGLNKKAEELNDVSTRSWNNDGAEEVHERKSLLNLKSLKKLDGMPQREQWGLVQQILNDAAVIEKASWALHQLLRSKEEECKVMDGITELVAKREEKLKKKAEKLCELGGKLTLEKLHERQSENQPT